MRSAVYEVDREDILNKVFFFLAEQGLENTSIREICRKTGIAQGSLYYWFDDKTAILCEAADYGLEQTVDKIFTGIDPDTDTPHIIDKIKPYEKQLRFIYQMETSPAYGERMRKKRRDFDFLYSKYAEKLAVIFGCEKERLFAPIYLLTSAVSDYIISGDEEKLAVQIEYIFSSIKKDAGI